MFNFNAIVLRHVDMSRSNIMVAYDDPGRVVGIVDWEGANVTPLWTCFKADYLLADLEGLGVTEEEVETLCQIRSEIHVAMQPELPRLVSPPLGLYGILWLITARYTTKGHVRDLNRTFLSWIDKYPAVALAFEELRKFTIGEFQYTFLAINCLNVLFQTINLRVKKLLVSVDISS